MLHGFILGFNTLTSRYTQNFLVQLGSAVLGEGRFHSHLARKTSHATNKERREIFMPFLYIVAKRNK